MSLSQESKERVTAMTGRVVLMLQQRDFSAGETSALILCLQKLLEHQRLKHGDITCRGCGIHYEKPETLECSNCGVAL